MPNFKTLCDAAVTMGEMSQGTADYFLGLYANSDECRELANLREEVAERRNDAHKHAGEVRRLMALASKHGATADEIAEAHGLA